MKNLLLIAITATGLMFLPKVNFAQTVNPTTAKNYTLFSVTAMEPRECGAEGTDDNNDLALDNGSVGYAPDGGNSSEPVDATDKPNTFFFHAVQIEASATLTEAAAQDVCTK